MVTSTACPGQPGGGGFTSTRGAAPPAAFPPRARLRPSLALFPFWFHSQGPPAWRRCLTGSSGVDSGVGRQASSGGGTPSGEAGRWCRAAASGPPLRPWTAAAALGPPHAAGPSCGGREDVGSLQTRYPCSAVGALGDRRRRPGGQRPRRPERRPQPHRPEGVGWGLSGRLRLEGGPAARLPTEERREMEAQRR